MKMKKKIHFENILQRISFCIKIFYISSQFIKDLFLNFAFEYRRTFSLFILVLWTQKLDILNEFVKLAF